MILINIMFSCVALVMFVLALLYAVCPINDEETTATYKSCVAFFYVVFLFILNNAHSSVMVWLAQ